MAIVDSCSSDNFVRTELLSDAQMRSLGPSPPCAQLGARGTTLKLIGSIVLSPEIYGQRYPGTFYVSPDLENELVLGVPWFEDHRVIYEHCLGCIYLGAQDRNRVYFNPEVQHSSTNIPTPQLSHKFPPEHLDEFLNLTKINNQTFHQGGPLRQTMAVQHEIHLSDKTTFREPPRRYSEQKRLWLDEQVRDMLANGTIEPTNSPYSSAIVVAGKKDGDYRFCVDYRRINKQTVDAPQCLPRIHEILKDIGGSRIFSTMDLKSGYWQIPLAPEARRYSAFTTPSGGQYQFRVMPFGLKNAPGTFQNLMRHVLADYWGKFAIAYLDDIIVYSEDWKQHLLHLALIFERLQIYGLTCSPQKCQFGQTSLPYLGHVVTSEGNHPQPKHLQAILDAEPPRTRKGLRSLLGAMNWLHEYVPHYSEITAAMTDLLSPKRPYKWNQEAQKALEDAKEAFRHHELLSRPEPSLPFILQTDASARGMGAVLMQQTPDGPRKIISYASAKFSPTEAAYHCNEQECLAVIWAITHFRPYLEDQRFILRTDSKTLTWLDRQKDTRDKLTRWHVLLSRFTFDIEHCPGKNNELPDALSRHPDPNTPSPGEPDIEQMVPPSLHVNHEASAEEVPVLHVTGTPSLFEEIAVNQLEDPEIERDIHRWIQDRKSVV